MADVMPLENALPSGLGGSGDGTAATLKGTLRWTPCANWIPEMWTGVVFEHQPVESEEVDA